MARQLALAVLLVTAACGKDPSSPVAGTWAVEFGDQWIGRWSGTMTLAVADQRVTGTAEAASANEPSAPLSFQVVGATDGSAILLHWELAGSDDTQVFAVIDGDRLDGLITGAGLSGQAFVARRK